MAEWISTAEAAAILEVHRQTVLRSLNDEQRRQEEWGDEGTGWRFKPLSGRKIFQVRRDVAQAKAEGTTTE